ncbi:HD domain-containing protein [Aeromonas caviae]|uniref:HD domain-containing protein n=1 Tax=Aeromonas TaxID=642 RepID=UPI001F1BBF67|nr:HD domain-containing protein [Aeromonas veronii]MCF5901473.1 HD domain-containing protein [Aeromonas veronii]
MKISTQLGSDLFITPVTLIDELFDDHFYSKIINTNAFYRLKGISFLGAIDKTHDNRNKIRSTRYQHSLDVAVLALFISKKRGYTKDVERILVTSALLHDIGHAPLSHSMEPEFHKKYGINHHDISLNIVSGRNQKFKELFNIVNNNTDINQVLDLINLSSREEFSDIFCSPINIDTIDGIHKTLKYCSNSDVLFNKFSVASAAFLENFKSNNNESRAALLDKFWTYKDFVYKHVINSGIGALADHYSKVFFNENNVQEELFISREESLFNNRKPIFKTFHETLRSIYIYKDNSIDECNDLTKVNSITFEVTNRNYLINSYSNFPCDYSYPDVESMKRRYTCNKRKGKLKIKYIFTNKNEPQPSIFREK